MIIIIIITHPGRTSAAPSWTRRRPGRPASEGLNVVIVMVVVIVASIIIMSVIIISSSSSTTITTPITIIKRREPDRLAELQHHMKYMLITPHVCFKCSC